MYLLMCCLGPTVPFPKDHANLCEQNDNAFVGCLEGKAVIHCSIMASNILLFNFEY